jgi:hypothetical protein
MKPDAFIDRDSCRHLIDEAKANRTKFVSNMFSSYKVARAVPWAGLMVLIAFGLVHRS